MQAGIHFPFCPAAANGRLRAGQPLKKGGGGSASSREYYRAKKRGWMHSSGGNFSNTFYTLFIQICFGVVPFRQFLLVSSEIGISARA